MPPGRPATRTRTRLTRRGRVVLTVLVLILLNVIAIGVYGLVNATEARRPRLSLGRDVPPVSNIVRPRARPTTTKLRLATVKGLGLTVPTVSPILVGYHEAARPEALGMRPAGQVVRNANPKKFRPRGETDGVRYVVMASRGRSTSATSAVDVALRRRHAVLAPVTGTVVEVRRYLLYDFWVDYRIAIRPAGRPRLQVVMIHVDNVTVRRGQRVEAGVTRIGTPRVFSFFSQVHDYVGWDVPHVHLEVKERGAQAR